METDLELTPEKDGFYGVYHEGTRDPDFAVVRVAGSGAPRENVISCSRFLFEAGYNVLCLGYYMWGDLGNTISEIPLDYVEKAIAWLKKHTGNEHLRIAMTGMSQGASYSLAAASYLPEICAVAAVSPFDHVMEGTTASFAPTGHSSYTFHGRELPYTPWTILKAGLPRLLFRLLRDPDYGFDRMLRYGYDKNGVEEASAIPVEKMHAALLLLAAKDDDCWPSEEAATRIAQRLKRCGYSHPIMIHIYEKGCHNMGGNMTVTGKTGKKIRRMMHAWKDHPQECLACIEDSKKQILDFFECVNGDGSV